MNSVEKGQLKPSDHVIGVDELVSLLAEAHDVPPLRTRAAGIDQFDHHAEPGTVEVDVQAHAVTKLAVKREKMGGGFDRSAQGLHRGSRPLERNEPVRDLVPLTVRILLARQFGESVHRVGRAGGVASAIKADEKSGGVFRRHLCCSTSALGRLNEAGLTHSPRYVVNRAAGASINCSHSGYEGGQSSHNYQSGALGAAFQRRSLYLLITQKEESLSSDPIFYPEFEIALHPATGEMRSLSRFEKLWLSFFLPAPSPSRRSVRKSAKETSARRRSPDSGLSRLQRFVRFSSSDNG